MHYTSLLEVSAGSYAQNIEFLKSRISPHTQISAVVKGNAYGHGIAQMVEIAENAGIRHFSTFSSDEARKVRAAKKQESEIMIMGMLYPEELPELIVQDIQFYVFDFYRLERAIQAAKMVGQPAQIHVEVETGFHRTGFEKGLLPQLIPVLKENREHLVLKGICTHYAGAESSVNHDRIREQINKFKEFKKILEGEKIYFERTHTACSAATLLFPETHADMVRIGIASYGFWPTQETFSLLKHTLEKENQNPLKRLITWKSEIMSFKKVAKGEFVGYGMSFCAPRDLNLAIVPIGYSHGYGRNLSNQGQVLIQGQFCPVIGTVNMNAIAVDISHLEACKPGEEVILIGNQGENEITVASFAETSHLVNYEMLSRLPSEIPRRVVD
ncbi:alanine racemase [Algoriphagus confluentis]|uniref:Alanine racemase n=1 Tax=Algoriphagus confluentis TaxID=1697556 RepID=A0ABQ6PQ02_9BACT|nr:alanine racemase [Algoriphagus confluentis]